MAEQQPSRQVIRSNHVEQPCGALPRRTLLGAVGAGAFAALGWQASDEARAEQQDAWRAHGKRIKHSVVHWCFQPMDVESLARAAAEMNIQSVELVAPEHWRILKKYNLACAIAPSHGFVRGLNNPAYHSECLEKLTKAIDDTAAAGWNNVITFSGMRENLSDEEGIANTVAGIKKIIGHAEKKKVNLCLEVLNSRVDVEMKGHPGYQADRIEWGVEVCQKVASPRMKILFDVYHVQIMQGDIITRIREYKDYIGHYHTAGVPGRNELDNTQEINYPAIMKAIAETGYQGYVAQEFIPRNPDKLAALRDAVRLCDV